MPQLNGKTAVIIGAGPAGLTAAAELLKASIRPIVLEKSPCMGGIARTVTYKGNRMDIGGHRFFSKSDRVMKWWLALFPPQTPSAEMKDSAFFDQVAGLANASVGADPEKTDRVMLIRNRKSRIYYLRRFFAYPIGLTVDTILKLGLWRALRIGLSYAWSVLFPIRPEDDLETFFTNRFGRELYETFFKSYTEKVWGVECRNIKSEWGAQRIKGLSITKAILHQVTGFFRRRSDVHQKKTETSLIERFLYPKLGPGQMWEVVAANVTAAGGEVLTEWEALGFNRDGNRITAIDAVHVLTGERRRFEGDFFLSSMPVQELVRGLGAGVPANVRDVAEHLVYRDFITVGVLARR